MTTPDLAALRALAEQWLHPDSGLVGGAEYLQGEKRPAFAWVGQGILDLIAAAEAARAADREAIELAEVVLSGPAIERQTGDSTGAEWRTRWREALSALRARLEETP